MYCEYFGGRSRFKGAGAGQGNTGRRDHWERQERLEDSAEEARTILSQRREVLDDVETITAYAQDLSETQVGCEDGRCGQLPVGVERGGFSAVLGPDRSCVAVWNRQQQGTLA